MTYGDPALYLRLRLKPNSGTYNFIEVIDVSGHNFESSHIEVSVYIANQIQTTFANWVVGGGVRSVRLGDCE